MARATNGFSGRELAKLLAAAQAAVYSSAGTVLTEAMFAEVVRHKIQEHHAKGEFGFY